MAIISHFFVSVISVLYDDADILESFFEKTIAVLKSNYQHYEFVLVDNGSQDETPPIIDKLLKKHESVRCIRLSRHFSTEAAISAGLDSGIGDAIVILEPQLDPPSLIPEMVEKIRQGAGVVFGVRKKGLRETFYCEIGRKIFYKICKMIMKFPPPENATYFIGLTREALNAIVQMKEEFRFVRIFGGYIGFKKQIFEYEQKPIRQKIRQESLRKRVAYAIDIIINNTTNPLVLVTYIGLLVSFLNIIYVGYLLLVALSKQKVVAGWLSSSMQISVMFFFVFVILSILCEYIGRLFDETKQRPVYFIEKEKNSSVLISDEDRKNIVKEQSDCHG